LTGAQKTKGNRARPAYWGKGGHRKSMAGNAEYWFLAPPKVVRPTGRPEGDSNGVTTVRNNAVGGRVSP